MRALFQDGTEGGKVRCGLCRHHCLVEPGKRGICAVRENRDGVLYSLVYDRVIAQNIDPIEKKPLFHFLPGSSSYSIATPGCNFRCKHCQNADISQLPRNHKAAMIGTSVSPRQIVDAAERSGCSSISYTYTEPTIFYELALDTAKLASERGLRNVFVTNGYISAEALKDIRPYLHAANVDLKAFTDEFYRNVCGARLDPVLESIRLYAELGIWTEITTLVIPGHNDSEEELTAIARFIRSISKDIPWHVSRFHPTYKMTDRDSTPMATLKQAREIGFREGLRYVYEGNVPGEGEVTFCGKCGASVIKRFGYTILENTIKGGACGVCHEPLAGIWS
ncbi:MAG: AmmeMemoRadiSam system radical SAM enzyme [Nitrospirota bacterium]|nr:AmmeMemoRadiSam system radical SAM enzyme [Nitrospirota bacterium]